MSTCQSIHPATPVGLILGLALLITSCAPMEGVVEPEEEDGEPEVYYRVQVHMTTDRSNAETVRSQVEAWWDDLPAEERPSSVAHEDLSAVVVWQQPYYRVRLGQFASREEAQELLPTARDEFSDALVARERNTTPVAQD